MRNIIVFDDDPWVSALFEKLSHSMPLHIEHVDHTHCDLETAFNRGGEILISSEKQSSLNQVLFTLRRQVPDLRLVMLHEPTRSQVDYGAVDLLIEKPIREGELLGSLAKILY